MIKVKVPSKIKNQSFNEINNGLYIIHWKPGGGGKSMAVIHRDHQGLPRFHCANWISTSSMSLPEYNDNIEFLEVVFDDEDLI